MPSSAIPGSGSRVRRAGRCPEADAPSAAECCQIQPCRQLHQVKASH
jgi:hypothetical protein